MSLLYWSPILRIAISVLVLVLAAFAPHHIARGLQEIGRVRNASNLDPQSLAILSQSNGMLFGGQGIDMATMRHLLDQGLVELNFFPGGNDISWGYRVTDLGRYVIKTQLRQEPYPEEFTELIRVRFWRREADRNKLDEIEFGRQQQSYEKFKISWEDAWILFALKMMQLEKPDDKKLAVITRWERYHARMSVLGRSKFQRITDELINPWLKEIKRKPLLLPNSQERIKILALDELDYRHKR